MMKYKDVWLYNMWHHKRVRRAGVIFFLNSVIVQKCDGTLPKKGKVGRKPNHSIRRVDGKENDGSICLTFTVAFQPYYWCVPASLWGWKVERVCDLKNGLKSWRMYASNLRNESLIFKRFFFNQSSFYFCVSKNRRWVWHLSKNFA